MKRLPREVWWLIGVTVVMAAVAAALSGSTSSRGGEAGKAPQRTTYSNNEQGLRALYVTLDKLGYRVSRWRRSFGGGTLPAGTLVIVDPATPIPLPEWQALYRWVSGGNTLLYCADLRELGDASPLPGGGLPLPKESESDATPSQPIYLAQGVTRLRVRTVSHFAPPGVVEKEPAKRRPEDSLFGLEPKESPEWRRVRAQAVPVFADKEGIVAVYARVGRGTLVVASSSWSLSNGGIGKGDNLLFVLNALGAPAKGPVYFDEYHQGFGENVTWALLPLPVKLALGQLLLAFGILVYARGRRFGRIVPLQETSRQRSEFLGTMTALLRRGEATHLAVRTAYEAVLRRQRRKLGLPEGAEAEEVGQAARRLDAKRAARLEAALQHAREALTRRAHLAEGRAMALIRELDEAESMGDGWVK